MQHDWVSIAGTVPSKSNCYRIISVGGHASLGKTAALRDYERAFYIQAGRYRGLDIGGLFELEVKVYYPSMRSDLDNSLKVLLDCLQTVKAIRNDNKCVRIVAEKYVDKAAPRVELRINDLDL